MGTAVAATPACTRDAFLAWLQTKRSTEVVGVSRFPRKCPLSMFLGDGEAAVMPTLYRLPNEEHYHPLPDWAVAFVRRLDSETPAGSRVTAGRALAILAAG